MIFTVGCFYIKRFVLVVLTLFLFLFLFIYLHSLGFGLLLLFIWFVRSEFCQVRVWITNGYLWMDQGVFSADPQLKIDMVGLIDV